MKLTIDTETRTLTVDRDGQVERLELYSPEAFAIVSQEWLKVGWSQKHSYTFTWLGRPIVQLPEDLLRVQEVVYHLRPDVIVETGVAHGGSLVYFASLCALMGHGRVVGVDVEIRPHNRTALDEHPLRPFITVIEGSSTDPAVVDQVRAQIGPEDRVMVTLDSNHTYAHVAAELRAYAPLVTPGSYLIVQDGLMRALADVPGGRPTWEADNPARAAEEFVAAHSEFVLQPPMWQFNESHLQGGVSQWPSGWLLRRAPEDQA